MRSNTGISLLVAITAILLAVALLTAGTDTLRWSEGAAIAFGAIMTLTAAPVLRMTWRGDLDVVAIMRQTGSRGAGARRWARACPAIMVGFALGGWAIGVQELAQWLQSRGTATPSLDLVGQVALGLAVAAFLTAIVAALSGRPQWVVPPQARSDSDFV